MEVGYLTQNNGDIELIESISDLMSHLNILLIKNPDNKFNQNLSMNSIEGKIISLKTSSSSAEQNENLLTELINYINERHSSLAVLITDQKKDGISHEIDLIESEVFFIKSKQLDENQLKKLVINSNLESIESEISFLELQNDLNLANVESEISFLKKSLQVDSEAIISKLKSDIPILDKEISQLNQVIIEDSNNLNLLKGSTLSIKRAAESPTLEQIIFSYKSRINQLIRERNNIISDISILSQKLDFLKKNTLQSDELFILEETKKYVENYDLQSDELFSLEKTKKNVENFDLQSDELFSLKQKQKTLKNQLALLENATLQTDKLFSLEQRQKTLENQLLMLTSQTQIKTLPIGNIETKTIKPKTQLTIVLSLITGFIAGIFLVFINTFIKSYRESKA